MFTAEVRIAISDDPIESRSTVESDIRWVSVRDLNWQNQKIS
jgi:hypothetical protein